MSYMGRRFRTGMNTEDVEGREIAKVLALEDIAKLLREIVEVLKKSAQ